MKILVTPENDMLKFISVRSIEAEMRSFLTPEDKKRIRQIKEEHKRERNALAEKRRRKKKAQKPNCAN